MHVRVDQRLECYHAGWRIGRYDFSVCWQSASTWI